MNQDFEDWFEEYLRINNIDFDQITEEQFVDLQIDAYLAGKKRKENDSTNHKAS